jgi:hypothetical protein
MTLLRALPLPLLLLVFPVLSGCRSADAAPAPSTPAPKGARDFDFEVGSWRVHHRTLKKHPDGGTEWVEFDGTSTNHQIMDGLANVEDNVFHTATGARRGVALRAFDPKTGQWAIWWLDERYPLGPVGPPVVGRFENGTGTFYSDDVVDGVKIRTRYIWGHITPTSARWEQAISRDSGRTWETNWTMQFERTR